MKRNTHIAIMSIFILEYIGSERKPFVSLAAYRVFSTLAHEEKHDL
jgi:hypothetical protein